MTTTSSTYRPCVGIMLFNKDKKIFVGQRVGVGGEKGAWQMPQGGIDDGEREEDAAIRELREETSITSASIVHKCEDMLQYDIPEELRPFTFNNKFVGQRQRWFLMEFHGTDDEIRIDVDNQEFVDWKWIDMGSIVDLAVYFKRDLYSRVIQEFSNILFR